MKEWNLKFPFFCQKATQVMRVAVGGGQLGFEGMGVREGGEYWRKSVVVSHVRSSTYDVPSMNKTHPSAKQPPGMVAALASYTSTDCWPCVPSPQYPLGHPHCSDQTHAPYLSSRCISVQHLLCWTRLTSALCTN